ncbi:helix-turn-helix transcriptional regulator [Streptomyces sp. NPDC050523]|uniref:helix-turn-helix transcriptional regulator n=1 Tax=Streptomyces sp. NPDC050523 TaxID=3365622 RepID=UPI00378DE09E
MRTTTRAEVFAGRDSELTLLRERLHDLAAGHGGAVWIEGEAGIGKTAFTSVALAGMIPSQISTASAEADELSTRSPLRVMRDCLQVTLDSEDDRRTQIARLLQGPATESSFDGTNPVQVALERLLALVDDMCSERPLVLVVDDVQWADETSLIAWHRLVQSVEQLPLLLIAISRPLPQRELVTQLRQSVLARAGARIALGPLAQRDVVTMLHRMLGAPPGERLQRLAENAGGNPMYLVEMVSVLQDEKRVEVGDTAELTPDTPDNVLHGKESSLADVIGRRLGHLPQSLVEALGAATLLGQEFSVTELCAVLGVPPSTLLLELRQATTSGLVTSEGPRLRFRHPTIRRALYEALPSVLREALHHQVAEMLAESGAPPVRVAEQLLSLPNPADWWSMKWTASHAEHLARQDPGLAAELLERVLDQNGGAGTSRQDLVVAALVKALFRLGRHEEAEKYAWLLLSRLPEEDSAAAEMRWLLARLQYSTGRNSRARAVVTQALRGDRLPAKWRARMLALSAMSLRAESGDLDGAEARLQTAMALAKSPEDPFGIGYVQCVLWLIHTVRRDHVRALDATSRALDILTGGPEEVELRGWAWEIRVFSLQNLDRLAEADAALRDALREAEMSGDPDRLSLHIGSAVQGFWTGRWDDTLAVLDAVAPYGPEATHFGLRDRGPVLLHHGIAAHIALHRDDRAAVQKHLKGGLAQPVETISDWENNDFMIVARALEADREGTPRQALSHLSQILDVRPGQVNLTHQWLPYLVRLALDLGDTALAEEALRICRAEAEREVVPARATFAAKRCEGLVDGNPAPLQEAAEHYATVGRVFERAQCLEDLAVLLAQAGRNSQARTALNGAHVLYGELGASWDIRRADARIRPYGVRRGVRGPRPKATFGWSALSPTELKVARLIAQGKSNPEVAADLFLSRRTVQTHVSHILAKLGVHSRVEIATAAMGHAEPTGSAD